MTTRFHSLIGIVEESVIAFFPKAEDTCWVKPGNVLAQLSSPNIICGKKIVYSFYRRNYIQPQKLKQHLAKAYLDVANLYLLSQMNFFNTEFSQISFCACKGFQLFDIKNVLLKIEVYLKVLFLLSYQRDEWMKHQLMLFNYFQRKLGIIVKIGNIQSAFSAHRNKIYKTVIFTYGRENLEAVYENTIFQIMIGCRVPLPQSFQITITFLGNILEQKGIGMLLQC